MNLIPTAIPGCYRVQLEVFHDSRGYFSRVFDLEALRGIDPTFAVIQVNRSLTRSRGAIRGLHFQKPPKAQDKLVGCLRGTVFDVCVDLRPDSPTHHQWVGFELSADNYELLLVPQGCAHGFQALTDDALVEYFVTDVYSPADEAGYRWDDPSLAIAWPLPCSQTSDKDAAWPLLAR